MSDDTLRPSRTVKVDTKVFREIQQLASLTSKLIHSSGHMPKEQKIPALARMKRIKTLCDEVLQLELFSQAQLED